MKFTLSFGVAAAVLFTTSSAASEPYPAKAIALRDALKALTYVGCYSSAGSLTKNSTYIYNTQGYCQGQCVSLTGGTKYPVLGTTNHTDCWCGDAEPPATDLVDDSLCDEYCAGYEPDMCGGDGYYSIWLTGEDLSSSTSASTSDSAEADVAASTTSTSGASITSATPSVVTIAGQVTTITSTPDAAASAAALKASESSGPNKTAIAAGVIVGIVLAAAIGGGGYLFMRHRRRRQIEEEYARNAAVSSFIGGGKGPVTSSANSFSDPRIDPAVLAQRRMSDGSIADNQDYTRRILKVTNA